MSVEFTVQIHEFAKAAKFLLSGRSRGKKAPEFIDLNARDQAVELVATGVTAEFPAEVGISGYARVPCPFFERFTKAIKTLADPSVDVSIEPGTIRAANLTFSNPDISILLIGARIAVLPINAALRDVLALSARFRPEEIDDSALLARVLAAQEEASRLIDRAAAILAPLGIERAALSQLVTEQIEMRARGAK